MTQEESVRIFKCLSDKSRLQIVAGLMNGEAYAELIAERLGLAASTVSFHMKKLEEAGLVESHREQYYSVYSLNKKLISERLCDLISVGTPDEDIQAAREAQYRRRVISTFFEDGKLKQIPAQRKKKLICYEEIVKKFEFGRVYSEKELSEIIAGINEDYCSIRRDMLGEGLLRRDGTQYERIR